MEVKIDQSWKKILQSEFDKEYTYNFDEKEKGNVNFNISLVKENCIQGFFNASN